jgi:AcrR family transcriptional regulator
MQKRWSSGPAAPGGPAETTEETASSQRRRIVEAMIAACAEKTCAATTIADIVARASVSRTTFYRCFDDKRSCFDAALEACIEEVGEVARAAVADPDPPARAVRAASAAVLERFAARPAVAQVLVVEAVAVDPAVLRRYRALMAPPLQRLLGPPRPGAISPGLALGRAQLLILNQLAGEGAARLPDLEPEIVYLALAPFLGHRAAVEQARPVTRGEQTAQR